MKPDAKPRKWMAKWRTGSSRGVIADHLEPTMESHVWMVVVVPKEAYEALEKENARLKDALGEGSGYMRLVVAFLTGCASSDKRFEQVLTLANKALEISSQALHGPREGE